MVLATQAKPHPGGPLWQVMVAHLGKAGWTGYFHLPCRRGPSCHSQGFCGNSQRKVGGTGKDFGSYVKGGGLAGLAQPPPGLQA